MKNMFVLNPVLEFLNPIFPGNKKDFTYVDRVQEFSSGTDQDASVT